MLHKANTSILLKQNRFYSILLQVETFLLAMFAIPTSIIGYFPNTEVFLYRHHLIFSHIKRLPYKPWKIKYCRSVSKKTNKSTTCKCYCPCVIDHISIFGTHNNAEQLLLECRCIGDHHDLLFENCRVLHHNYYLDSPM